MIKSSHATKKKSSHQFGPFTIIFSLELSRLAQIFCFEILLIQLFKLPKRMNVHSNQEASINQPSVSKHDLNAYPDTMVSLVEYHGSVLETYAPIHTTKQISRLHIF